MLKDKVVGNLIRNLYRCGEKNIINDGLDMKEDVKLMSRIIQYMNKKTECNFYYLLYFFAKAICLRIIGCAIKELHPQFVEQHYLKLIEKLGVIISN